MAGLSVRDPAVDRSLRSVFVGNIPYEATEEQLKDIFSEVGPVVSFRLVYDRETGKPKGYGFCEYQDQETALSAMRNLNGREFSGRALRVDNAASEKNKEELKSLGTGAPIIESPYGDPVNPEDAPESISRAVASLPPWGGRGCVSGCVDARPGLVSASAAGPCGGGGGGRFCPCCVASGRPEAAGTGGPAKRQGLRQPGKFCKPVSFGGRSSRGGGGVGWGSCLARPPLMLKELLLPALVERAALLGIVAKRRCPGGAVRRPEMPVSGLKPAAVPPPPLHRGAS